MAVLIVDDDPVQRRLLEGMVQKFGYEVITAEGGDAAATLLTGPDGAGIDCVVLDLVMPDLDGLGVLARLRHNAVTVPVIVQTAHGGIDNVVSAMRAGAADFVVKPVGAERLQVSLRNALNTSALEGELNRIKHSRSGTLGFKDIITKSPAMQAVLRMAEKASASTIPVLIAGESGVGKELIARAIHGSGERRAKPFVAVNCGAMPENLIESILFGHEKGSFTGATERPCFTSAIRSRLVAETTRTSTLTGLRAPTGSTSPSWRARKSLTCAAGGSSPTSSRNKVPPEAYASVRICSTGCMCSRSRCHLCGKGKTDVPPLARHFVARFAAEEGKRIRMITPEAVRLLRAFHWPGNIRQLENAVFRAVVLTEGDAIDVAEFPQITAQIAAPAVDLAEDEAAEPLVQYSDEEISPVAPFSGDTASTSDTLRAAALDVLALLNGEGDVRPLEDLEAEVIRYAIAHYRGQMSEVARRLQIGRSTLYRKLEALGLNEGRGAANGEDEAVATARQPMKIA